MAIASGTCGTCPWEISDSGVLTIGAGTLADNTENDASFFDWARYGSQITSVVLSETVVGNNSIYGLFHGLLYVSTLDLSNLNTSNVINMGEMCSFCYELVTIDVSNLDTNNVTNMFAMFGSCEALTTIDISGFDMSNVTDMSFIFEDCPTLKSITMPTITVNNITNMSYMFSGCQSLTSLDLSSFNTSKVINMTYLFYNCSSLTALDLSNFDTSSVTNMSYMFYNCYSLTSLNLSSFSFNNTTNISYMFWTCINLKTLIFGQNLDTSNINNMNYAFYNCQALEEFPSSFKLGGQNLSHTFSSCRNLKGKIYTHPAKNSVLIGETFANTVKDIYLIDIPVSDYSCWRSIASNYDNVHCNADDVSNPTVTINSIKRVDSDGKIKPNGDYILVEIILTLYTNNLPEGWETRTFTITVNEEVNPVQMYNPPIEIPSIEENQKVYKCSFMLNAPSGYSLDKLTITQTIISEEV